MDENWDELTKVMDRAYIDLNLHGIAFVWHDSETGELKHVPSTEILNGRELG